MVFFLSNAVYAFCGTYVSSSETALISRTSQVVMVRQDQKTTLTLYTDRLVQDGLIPEGEIEDLKAGFQSFSTQEISPLDAFLLSRGSEELTRAVTVCSFALTSFFVARPLRGVQL